ncbi:glucosamine/galactosamine-6-phosphate isomerases signature [Lucifera butyrica]|uniref:Glucosamine-6-phosphate deaminase n=1 Tax=Lucifera butyrica TaxID=1351585 RepID=A0A498R3J1_9FIRM|nr:glucosamine-6-phosphate deaminase [Lucifera butyrica]VBB05370.1 glucosamine/galactosamine-6-phosphate isomerases signature [Lucifera butyrica]
MRIVFTKDYEEMSLHAAKIVAGQLYLKPNSVLGLATGSTPLAMYRELIRMNRENGLDFSETVTFNLDEYIGLGQEDENSYYYYMYHNFFNHINIRQSNIHIPSGLPENVEEECQKYDDLIAQSGGIDLQILGIGQNGHIGFNEPDIKFEATTHMVKLDDDTIKANARFFATVEEVPIHALSMGIKTIMHARKILLLANGAAKAEALFRTLYGGITPETPASILQLHQDVTVIVEEEAARLLRRNLNDRTSIGCTA